MLHSTTIALALATSAYAWLPAHKELAAFNTTARIGEIAARSLPSLPSGVSKVRGVNLGGWLITEPWMVCDSWRGSFGCGTSSDNCGAPETMSSPSESDCMKNNYSGSKRQTGNDRFATHWANWITPQSIQDIHDAGLNTIRIPIGYWSNSALVRSDETFPDGSRQLPYLDAVISKAADLGMYVIIDLHGAPGRQQSDAFTGQNPNLDPYFFQSDNYAIAEKWLSWMTERIHSTPSYQKAVGMIEVLNEPTTTRDPDNRYQKTGQDNGLLTDYYPNALKAVRDKEASMGVSADNSLHVQFMSKNWIPGNPRMNAAVAADTHTGFDDHNYIGFGNSDRNSLLSKACTDDRSVKNYDFQITGEWSNINSVSGDDDGSFYKQYFTAQQQLYEKPANGDKPAMDGWIYWTWKTQTNNPDWDYQLALSKGWIPKGAAALEQNVYQDVCSGHR